MSLAQLTTLLVIPPVNMMLLACAGLALRRWAAGRAAVALGLAGLLAASMPVVSGNLIYLGHEDDASAPRPAPQAIVVLGGDETDVDDDGTPAYAVGGITLERERAAAALSRRTGLPILVSGGRIRDGSPSLATLMSDSLRDDFRTAVRWTENGSGTTWENARMSAPILRRAGVSSAYLVTSGWHMRRAMIAFRGTGVSMTPAPVERGSAVPLLAQTMLPYVACWRETYFALHEIVGSAWYRLLQWREATR